MNRTALLAGGLAALVLCLVPPHRVTLRPDAGPGGAEWEEPRTYGSPEGTRVVRRYGMLGTAPTPPPGTRVERHGVSGVLAQQLVLLLMVTVLCGLLFRPETGNPRGQALTIGYASGLLAVLWGLWASITTVSIGTKGAAFGIVVLLGTVATMVLNVLYTGYQLYAGGARQWWVVWGTWGGTIVLTMAGLLLIGESIGGFHSTLDSWTAAGVIAAGILPATAIVGREGAALIRGASRTDG